ncbi:MAG: hypothetical protein BYD32DRAFT_240387 [Podila humilis]|nr:MAG: hypothetical protein BYD32DRAFT_240387 [Podila humilis]
MVWPWLFACFCARFCVCALFLNSFVYFFSRRLFFFLLLLFPFCLSLAIHIHHWSTITLFSFLSSLCQSSSYTTLPHLPSVVPCMSFLSHDPFQRPSPFAPSTHNHLFPPSTRATPLP